MQSVPVFLRSGVRQAFVLALLVLREAYTRGTAPQQTRAWKLFLLAPRLLLHRPREPGTVGREALLQRSRDFLAGRWDTLLSATRTAAAAPRAGSAADVAAAADAEAFRERRRALACANVRRGEVSRARATLTSAAVAPGRGTAAGLSGPTSSLPRAFPGSVSAALGLSRLTALRKPGGGVRGIATGDTFRRLVSRSLARMFADTFDEATRPYQFALQTRAGTDALSGMLRAAVDLDSAATIVSLDGRSAYDTISRTAFLRKLHAVAP
ncbi:unnamed protein product, partial [Symbiodinium sp. KB8]